MKIYFPIEKVDAERREVWGYASTEARDDQGEVVKRDALIAALGDYMRFANIREMHQLSAVGVVREAAVDDKGLYVGAKIVDDQAWEKVVEGVYKGYSIGGRVTQRDPSDYKIITGLTLHEISLVDRPANPEAIFDYWKAGGAPQMPESRLNPPFQIWACGVPEHRHLAKSDALKCQKASAGSGINLMAAAQNPFAAAEGASEAAQTASDNASPYGEVAYADPGYQADGQKRYPIDTERHIRAAWNLINRPSNAELYTSAQLDDIKSRIVAAWKEKIGRDGPLSAEKAKHTERGSKQSALTKALWDVGHIARVILELQWLQESLAIEADMEGDASPQPSRLQAIIAELRGLLNTLVAEETGEILDNNDVGAGPAEARAAEIVMMAAGARGAALLADLYRGRNSRMNKLAAAMLAKAKHSNGDQALLDLAYHAVDKCMGINSLLSAERSHLSQARDALKAASSHPGREAADGKALDLEVRPSVAHPRVSEALRGESTGPDISKHPSFDLTSEMLELVAAALAKKSTGDRALMDIAHDCIGKLTDGACCVASKVGTQHSLDTLNQLTKAHDHLVLAGAKCDATNLAPKEEWEGMKFEPARAETANLTKILAEERAEKATLIATLTDIMPRLDQLTKRVEDIARTPLPPLAIAKNVAAISKQQDAGGAAFSPDQLAAAFARMSKEEQTLTLIKASYARPIHPPGLAPTKDMRSE